MRITGGLAKSIPLCVPSDDKTRPATDSLRTSLFATLGALVEEKNFIDLFAGTGAYGLEAWSRGALGESSLFVEKSYDAINCIKQNIASVGKSIGITEKTSFPSVIKEDVFSFLQHTEKKFDLIFIDPPYPRYDSEKFTAKLWNLLPNIIGENTSLIIEVPGRLPEPSIPGLQLIKRHGKGKSSPTILIYQACPV